MSNQQVTVSVKEKFAYGMGDTAANIVFQVVINFLLYFYTDVYGLSAGAVGTLFLVIRLFDAFTDPVMAGVADRTQTRWGRYRPYLLWMAVPYGIMAVLAFTTPDIGDSGKLLYAYVTYALLMLLYTMTNIPYSALGGVMTASTTERASIQSYRFAMAMVGGAIVTAAVTPLVDLFGQGDKQQGFQYTMMVLGAFAAVCFFICFAFTKERITPDKNEASTSVWHDIKLTLQNDQWRLIALATFFLLISVAMKGSATPYYVRYYLGEPDNISSFLSITMVAGVFGAVFSNWAVKRYCKVKLIQWATLGMIVFNFLLYLVPADWYFVALAAACIANFAQMIFIPLVFSAVPDTVDYGNKVYGKTAMAMSFSGHLLALKFGIAIGGALSGWLLEYSGYVANQDQTDTALMGITSIFALSTAVTGVIVYFILRQYKLSQGFEKTL